MKYGWITANILDLWSKPKYNSERINQILYTDIVEINKSEGNFINVKKEDAYTGWVDNRFVKLLSKKDYLAYTSKRNQIVTAKTAKTATINDKKSTSPYLLYYGTKLCITSVKKNMAIIALPDKNKICLKLSTIKPIYDNKSTTGGMLVNEAKKMIGIPYLWGGLTAAGFDCSGLVQTICSRFGILMPRDTKDQILIGEKIERETIKTGDLLFFKRHVGFAIGKNQLIHSSIGSNGVRIESLDENSEQYRKDLALHLKIVRRII